MKRIIRSGIGGVFVFAHCIFDVGTFIFQSDNKPIARERELAKFDANRRA